MCSSLSTQNPAFSCIPYFIKWNHHMPICPRQRFRLPPGFLLPIPYHLHLILKSHKFYFFNVSLINPSYAFYCDYFVSCLNTFSPGLLHVLRKILHWNVAFFKWIYTVHPGDFIKQTSGSVMYLFEMLKCLPKTFRIKKQILASETKPFMIELCLPFQPYPCHTFLSQWLCAIFLPLMVFPWPTLTFFED